MRVKLLMAAVQTKDGDGQAGPRERLVVLTSCEAASRTWYALTNAHAAGRAELAFVHGACHRIEEQLKEGKQEVGLSHDEVRSWVGWRHYMTLSLLTL